MNIFVRELVQLREEATERGLSLMALPCNQKKSGDVGYLPPLRRDR